MDRTAEKAIRELLFTNRSDLWRRSRRQFEKNIVKKVRIAIRNADGQLLMQGQRASIEIATLEKFVVRRKRVRANTGVVE